MKNHVGIVIVSYNSASELDECIEAARVSLKTADFTGEIVVVDNNSKDDSVKLARKLNASVIENGVNLGFAKAVNVGLKHLLKNGATHLLILNPDAMLDPNNLKVLAKGFEENEGVGATGPSMLDLKGDSATSGYYLKAPSWISILLFSTFIRPHAIKNQWLVRRFLEETNLAFDREVEQVPGACLFTSKEVLEDIGMLDEDFAIWYEDVEWCYRARKHGYKMWFCKDAYVVHEGGVSFAKWQSLDKAVTFYVSMKTFFRKHKKFSYPIVIAVVLFNSFVMYLKTHDKSNLTFAKKFLKQRRGILPT